MLTTYYNTTENTFFDADGSFWRDFTPELAVKGNEKINLILVKDSPENTTAEADPETWERDSSWSEIQGISALLTIDDDYQHRIKGTVSAEIASGSTTAALTMPGVSDFAEIPAAGIVTFYSATGASESVSYSARSVEGNVVTFTLGTAVVGSYPASAAADAKQSPLAMAYLNADESDWTTGSLVFDLAIDSARLRSLAMYSDSGKVNINGVEFLFYRTNENSETIILRRILWDTPSLVKPMGDPGFPAPLPDLQKDYIAAEIKAYVDEAILNGSW